MSDQSPSTYWQFDQEAEEEAQGTRREPAGTSTPANPKDAGGTWRTPVASPPDAAALQVSPPPIVRPARTRHRHTLLNTLLALLAVVLLGVAGSVSGFGVSRVVGHHGQVGASPRLPGLGQVRVATPRLFKTAHPSASPTPRPTPVGPTPRPQAVILAQDDFQRPNQALWGDASDGSTWGGDANASAVFAIVDGTGQERGGQGFFNAILGPLVANEEVVYSGSVSHFDNLRDNLGAVLRWTDGNHYYKAYLDGVQLVLIKRVAGVVTRLGAVRFPAQGGVRYSLRFRVVGTQLLVRAWPARGTEPGTWMIAASDGELASGFGGLRALLEPGITITVTTFVERSIA